MDQKPTNDSWARLIDEAINQANKSTKEVADEIGVHQETVRRWRKGDRLPTRVALFTLSTLLAFDFDEALQLYVQAKVEVEEGDQLFGMVLPPKRVSEELVDLKTRVAALEEQIRNHTHN